MFELVDNLMKYICINFHVDILPGYKVYKLYKPGPDTELFRGGGGKRKESAKHAKFFCPPSTNFAPPPSK